MTPLSAPGYALAFLAGVLLTEAFLIGGEVVARVQHWRAYR